MPKKKDLTGMKFGRWTVMYEAEPHYTSGGNRKIRWHCICSCENHTEKDINSGDLFKGGSLSCGCYNSEIAHRSKNKKYNKYDLTGDYGIGYDSKGNEFWFDLEDYDKIKNYCWNTHHTKYICTHDKNHKWMLLHKLIMNDLDNVYDIDHIKTENKFDNRKSNLRIVSRSENNRNHVIPSDCSSGVPGVRWKKRNQIWEVYININKKSKYVGGFKIFDDAVKARKEAEKKYYGNYSYDASQQLAKNLNENYKKEINYNGNI